MKKPPAKSRRASWCGIFDEEALMRERRSVRRVVVENLLDGDPSSSLAAGMMAGILRHADEETARATFVARAFGVTLRATAKGWRVTRLRRVIFFGITFEEFLAEFFPDAAPAAPAKEAP
jgi:hypothetical protein